MNSLKRRERKCWKCYRALAMRCLMVISHRYNEKVQGGQLVMAVCWVKAGICGKETTIEAMKTSNSHFPDDIQEA
jgi:hypothetical protein